MPADGLYQVSAAFTKAVDYGIFGLSPDGQPLGSRPFDLFQKVGVSQTGELPLVSLELEKGEAVLGVRSLGANPEAVKGVIFGLDFARLTKIKSDARAIFDGKSLDGWAGEKQWWRIEGGATTGKIPSGGSLAKIQFWFWDGQQHDFELLKYLTKEKAAEIPASRGLRLRKR